MLSATIIFEDLMDRQPVAGVQGTLHARVLGRWTERIAADDLSEEFDNTGVALPKNGVTVPVPDFDRAIAVARSGVSDTPGQLEVSFNLDAAFRQIASLKKNGDGPVDVGAVLSVDASVEGVDFTARFLKDTFSDSSENLLGKNDSVTRRVPVDFGKIVVGHVTDTTARLFFRIHGEIGLGDYVCEIFDGEIKSSQPLQSHLFRPNAGAVNSAVVDVADLRPAHRYVFKVFVRDNAGGNTPGAGRRLLSGSFRTDDPAADRVEFAFASCHNPIVGTPSTQDLILRAWRDLESRRDYEMLLLIGDQIYGDGIELPRTTETWRNRYLRRYDRFFIYPEIRQILRRTPTYMMLHDHDVVDDYGVVPVRELVSPPNPSDGTQRVAGALAGC